MARPLRIEYPGAFYHIIQRGIERKAIFISPKDKDRFLGYLISAHTRYYAIIHSYVLMDNHYHLILETPQPNLSKIMHYLNTSYAVYFNTKRKRVGPLYQGRFKSIVVQQDEYLHHLSRYIHLNPLRIKLVKDPIEYPWSSYKYFASNTKPPEWLNMHFIHSIFNNNPAKARKLYKQFVFDGIGKEKSIIEENTKSGLVLGNEDFFESIRDRFVNSKEDYEIPVLNEIRCKQEPTPQDIENIVKENIKNNPKLQRKISIYLSRKYTQRTLKEIAEFYANIKYTGISQVFRRVEAERRDSKGLEKQLAVLENLINV